MKIVQTYFTEDNTICNSKSFTTEAEAKAHLNSVAKRINSDLWKDKEYTHVFWKFRHIEVEENKTVQKALQEIYNKAEALENHDILDQVLKITESLNIEILM